LLAAIIVMNHPELYKMKFIKILILSVTIIFSCLSNELSAFAEDVPISDASTTDKTCKFDLCFPNAVKISDQVLPLRNIVKKKYLIFDVYVASMYLPANITKIDQVLGDFPKKLAFRYLRSLDGKRVIRLADDILEKNPELDLKPLQSRMQKINEAYVDGMNDGDLFELVYQPNRGTSLIINGKEFCTIAGLDFAKAYFGIWLSKYPMSETFRDELINSN
jgi:hypothetical protein